MTRGLLELNVKVPVMRREESFEWLHVALDELPLDAIWFIDGSMFDNDFYQFKCTGFAVVVVSRHGELLGYGRGVPPPWVRDAAAAEA